MSKVTGIKVDFLKNFLDSFVDELSKLDQNKSIYESTDFVKLSTQYQSEFLNSIKNMQGNVWAMKKELELMEMMLNKLFSSGPMNQPSVEKAQELYSKLLSKDTDFGGTGNFH